jgi:phosphoglycolate phosphatase
MKVHEAGAVLFDLDGTLAETAPDLSDTVNMVLTQHTPYPALPESLLRTFIGGGLTLMFKKALAHFGANEDQLSFLIERGMEVYPQFNGKRTYLYAGMHEALDILAGKGILLGVVTNKSERFTFPLLKTLEIQHYMGAIVGGDTLPNRKPEPDQIYLACKQLGVLPSKAVMVGDSIFDIQAAKNAGCVSVVVDYGYTEIPPEQLGADYLITSVLDFVRQHFSHSG